MCTSASWAEGRARGLLSPALRGKDRGAPCRCSASPPAVPSALGLGEVLPSEDSAALGVVLRDFAGPEWVVWVWS